MAAADRVRTLIPRLIEGDLEAVIDSFCDEAVVETPQGGRQVPLEWARAERAWLCRGGVTSSEVNTVDAGTRVAHELVVVLSEDERERQMPVILIAENDGDRIASLYGFYDGPGGTRRRY